MLIATAAVLTTATIAAITTWRLRNVRRALTAERAARRLADAAHARDHAAHTDRRDALLDAAANQLHRRLLEEHVLNQCAAVIDRAYADATATPDQRRGEHDA